jgi:hypothetical protein
MDYADGSLTVRAATTCTATFSGSLKVQMEVFHPSSVTWLLDLNSNGTFDNCTIHSCPASFGVSSDRPVVGDWTGTGTMQLGTFDPSTKVWELDRNAKINEKTARSIFAKAHSAALATCPSVVTGRRVPLPPKLVSSALLMPAGA